MLAIASSQGTAQQRRERYLKLAAEAEIAAAKLSDPKAKAAWIDAYGERNLPRKPQA
jgi:hypothetical protein